MAIFTPVKYQTGQSDSLYWGAITAFSRSTDKTSAGSLKLLKNTSTAILQDMFQLSLAGKKKKNSGDKSLQQKRKKISTAGLLAENQSYHHLQKSLCREKGLIKFLKREVTVGTTLKPCDHHARKLQLLKGQEWAYSELGHLNIVRE